MLRRWQGGLAGLVISLSCTTVGLAREGGASSSQALSVGKTPEGRPDVHLDRLDFPADVPHATLLKKHLAKVLKTEARRVEWGAGRDNRIEYRFAVTHLNLRTENGVLRVSCSALGTLPGGKTAKSQLTFGGHPSERDRVIKQVLEIVARGVITRLAQLERRRRGLD